MSWFDAAGLASFAKNALSTAQKTIDKALDIKDIPPEKAVGLSDVDFFETYGLGITAIPANPVKQSPQTTTKPTDASQSSNYWTDTWGSFFETKAPVPEVPGPSTSEAPEAKHAVPSPNKIASTSDAVFSQPQRAALFPSGRDVEKKPVLKTAFETDEETEAEEQEPYNKDESKPEPEEENSIPVTQATESETENVRGDEEKSTIEAGTEDPALKCSDELPTEEPVEAGNVSEVCSVPCITVDEPQTVSSVELAENVSSSSLNTLSCGSPDEGNESCSTLQEDDSSPGSETSRAKECDMLEADERLRTYSDSTIVLDDVQSVPVKEKSLDCTAADSHSLYQNNFTGSFVNLETKDADSKTDSSESSIPESENESREFQNYGDSFHILGTSVLSSECGWGIETDSHIDDGNRDSSPEGHQSGICDSGSTTSKEDEMEVRECDVKSICSGGSQEISNSFVKCSMEEVDDGCHRGQSPFSTTTSERSDVMKLESEQNTSGDENETTTSSDIEILSAPNGENGDRHSSPLKHMWVPRTIRMRRSESPSSDCSKDSSVPATREGEDSLRSKRGTDRMSGTHGFEAEKHLECCAEEKIKSADLGKLFQQQDELRELLDAREKKVIELNKENLRLREVEENLQNQLQELRRNLASDSHTMSNMTKELTRRLSQLEEEAHKAIMERDSLKKKFEEAQIELSKRISLSEMEETLKEKDQQIKELLQEGEKLSKKELQHTTIIKKLRAKEEEMEHSIKSLKEKLEENSKEVERLRRSMGAKDEQEKKHIDAIRQLTNLVNKHEKELVSLKNSLEDSVAREQGLRNSLDGTLRELTELRSACTSKDKEIQELTISVDLAAREKLREGLDQANREACREKEALVAQIEDLRNSLKHTEEESNSRENALKEEISRLQLRLQESEGRNEELTKSISTATRPLARQIETLQASYNSQIASWEKIERNLSDQLSDCQNQLAVSTEREKLATEKYIELSSKCNKLELQNSELRQHKSQLTIELQLLKSKVSDFEDSKERDDAAMNKLRQNFAQEIKQLKEEKERLTSELQNSLELLKEERQAVRNLQEELKMKEKSQGAENTSPCPSPSASLRSSVESINNWGQDDFPDRRLSTPVNSHRISVYDSLRIGCTTSVLENLQSQLKQREGEIAQLQCEITKLERERESLAQELVEVTTENEGLQETVSKLQSIEKLYKDVNQRYNTLLQMYGEKVEECEELKLDLTDVKTAYKVQIEELLSSKTIT